MEPILSFKYFGCHITSEVREMYNRIYVEYPENALIFSFPSDKYFKPKQLKQFFKAVNSKFGKRTQLRSFTMFDNMFQGISFWIDDSKMGSIVQKVGSNIRREPNWMVADKVVEDFAKNLSLKFGFEIVAMIKDVNKRQGG